MSCNSPPVLCVSTKCINCDRHNTSHKCLRWYQNQLRRKVPFLRMEFISAPPHSPHTCGWSFRAKLYIRISCHLPWQRGQIVFLCQIYFTPPPCCFSYSYNLAINNAHSIKYIGMYPALGSFCSLRRLQPVLNGCSIGGRQVDGRFCRLEEGFRLWILCQ